MAIESLSSSDASELLRPLQLEQQPPPNLTSGHTTTLPTKSGSTPAHVPPKGTAGTATSISGTISSSGSSALGADVTKLINELQGFLLSLQYASTDSIGTTGNSSAGTGTKITSFTSASGTGTSPR